MSFEDQQLGRFVDARASATELLRSEGVKERVIGFEEAFIMQAASHVLSLRDNFYGLEIVRLVGAESGAVYPTLNRFEDRYGITTSIYEGKEFARERNRRPRREYRATDFGKTVFGLFTPSE